MYKGNGPGPIRWQPDRRWIRRTIIATLLALGLVGLNLAVYAGPATGAIYVGMGLWALVFFALSPLIFKVWLFDGRHWAGIGLLALKLGWMGLLALALAQIDWERLGLGASLAMAGGIITPLAVVVLRALGSLKHQPRRPSIGTANQQGKG